MRQQICHILRPQEPGKPGIPPCLCGRRAYKVHTVIQYSVFTPAGWVRLSRMDGADMCKSCIRAIAAKAAIADIP